MSMGGSTRPVSLRMLAVFVLKLVCIVRRQPGVGVKRPCPHSLGDGSLEPRAVSSHSRALRRPIPGVGRRASDEEVQCGVIWATH